jgi:hypothetical protein
MLVYGGTTIAVPVTMTEVAAAHVADNQHDINTGRSWPLQRKSGWSRYPGFMRRQSLPEHHRRANAIAAASTYAPRPEGSSFTYGLIAMVLAILALVIFGMFYGLEVLANPVMVGLGMAAFFVFGVLLRKRRKRLYTQAFERELRIREDLPHSE